MTTITPDQYRQLAAAQMTEKAFQAEVVKIAESLGWYVYHPYDSRRSEPGYPDLTMAHPSGRLIFAELKTEAGRLSGPQKAWGDVLQAVERAAQQEYTTPVRYVLWRPHHLVEGTIHRTLEAA